MVYFTDTFSYNSDLFMFSKIHENDQIHKIKALTIKLTSSEFIFLFSTFSTIPYEIIF